MAVADAGVNQLGIIFRGWEGV